MDQLKAILATLLIFGSGVGTGHLLTRQSEPKTPAPPQNGTPEFQRQSNGKETRPARPVFFRSSGYLDRHLELSEEQKNQIRELTKQCHQHIFEFGEPFRKQLHEEHRELQEQIRGILTPEQTQVFDNLPHFRFNKEPGRPKGHSPHRPGTPPHRSGPPPHFQKKPASPSPGTPPDKLEQSGKSLPDLKNA